MTIQPGPDNCWRLGGDGPSPAECHIASGVGDVTIAAIIPLYNKRRTVLEAIESVIAQTRPVDEIVIVDDASTDGSFEEVAQRYGGDRRFRLLRHRHNLGVSAARNNAIRSTRCELLAFLDADDRWLPERIEKHAAVMGAKPSCMLAWSAHIIHNEATNVTRVEGERIDKDTYLCSTFFREKLLPASGGVTVRRKALDVVGMFDESLWMGEDTDLWLRIMLRFGFEHIPQPLVWMRRGRQVSIPSMERGFVGNDRYFAKHRYTFGRGLRGQVIWRRAYSSVLRRHASWYFRNGMGLKAMISILKSVAVWPLFDSTITFKYALEYALGTATYTRAVALMRQLVRRGKSEGRHV